MPLVNAPSAPPKTRASSTPRKSSTPPPNPNKIRQEREDSLNGLFQVGSAILIATNQWADAGAISAHGPNVSRETAKIAERYEKVGNALDALAQVGPFTALLGAVMPMLIQIAANHGRIPAEKVAAFGIKDPRVLESEMRMEARRQAFAYQQAVAEQEHAMRNMEAEWDALQHPWDAKSVSRETVTVE